MPKKVVPLTDSKIKATQKQFKANINNGLAKDLRLSDGDGLNLIFRTSGAVLWRFDYTRPITKKRNTLAIGNYPEITLAEARGVREEYRALISKNIDPQTYRKDILDEAKISHENTFRKIAEEFKTKQILSPATVVRNERIYNYLYEEFGEMPISEIKPKHLVKVIRKIESRGTIETAHRTRSKASQIFRYAVSLGFCERDIAHDLIGTIKPREVRHYSALVEESDFAQLLKDIEVYEGYVHTKFALKILPHVFVRTGELRHAKWSDINFEERTWSYTPPKTLKKTGVEHIVPLSDQVIELLKELKPFCYKSDLLFPSISSKTRPMSDMTINMALRRMGYDREKMTGHGFRAIARTLLEEKLKFHVERIEQQLAHQVRDMHGRAYNRTKFLEERAEMMQAWSNYIDKLKAS